MSQTAKLYFDVTQLAHWSGKITGIPRVMEELAKRYYAADKSTVFVVWVKDLQEFCEIDFNETILQRRGIVYKRVGDPDGAVETGSTTPHAPAAESSRPMPTHTLKRGAIKVAKKGLAVTGRISPAISQKIEARARQQHMSRYKQIVFQKADVLFIPWGEWWDPTFTDRLVRAHDAGVRLVQIIHDMGTIVWPQFFEQVKVSPATYNARIVPIADLVLAISKNTKKELIAWLKAEKLPVPNIQIFRLGDDIQVAKSVKPDDDVFKAAKLKGNDYIMCVGTIEAKKNHLLFYYVYKLAKTRGVELPKIAIVGRRGWHTDEAYALMSCDPEVKDKFVFLHGKSDEELTWLYDHCLFTVLPSFHEGWGLPIAESLGRGVPCICSNTSSMVEIAEGIVDHFSPASSDECLAAIERLLSPTALQAARKRAKTYKQFTWDESFAQVKSHLEKLLS